LSLKGESDKGCRTLCNYRLHNTLQLQAAQHFSTTVCTTLCNYRLHNTVTTGPSQFLSKYRGIKSKQNEMGGASGSYEGEEKYIQDFGWET